MARLVTYKCPDCKGEFDFLHHPSTEPPPDECELCGSYMGDDPRPAPVLHLNVGKDKNKVGDKLYRDMEKATDARIEHAAEMTGASVTELSGMRMTNMKDNMRAGDQSSMSVTEAEKRLSVSAMGQTVGPQMQQMGDPVQQGQPTPEAQERIAAITTGPAARATRGMIEHVQQSGRHNATISGMTQRGQLGKH